MPNNETELAREPLTLLPDSSHQDVATLIARRDAGEHITRADFEALPRKHAEALFYMRQVLSEDIEVIMAKNPELQAIAGLHLAHLADQAITDQQLDESMLFRAQNM